MQASARGSHRPHARLTSLRNSLTHSTALAIAAHSSHCSNVSGTATCSSADRADLPKNSTACSPSSYCRKGHIGIPASTSTTDILQGALDRHEVHLIVFHQQVGDFYGCVTSILFVLAKRLFRNSSASSITPINSWSTKGLQI